MRTAAGGSDNQAVAMVTVKTPCKHIAVFTVIGTIIDIYIDTEKHECGTV